MELKSMPEEWRAGLRKAYVDLGAEPADAAMIVDMSVHAVDKAFDALNAVMDSCTDYIRSNAQPLAFQLLAVRAEGTASILIEAAQERGKAGYREVSLDQMLAETNGEG
jgi:hypothetical protein